jgi:hypothetical protein
MSPPSLSAAQSLETAMRAIICLIALLLSVPANAQAPGRKAMYVRPPFAVLCERLDFAKIVAQAGYESRRAGSDPQGCRAVRPNIPVMLLDRFDDYAYVEIESVRWRAFVHIGALTDIPERAPPRRRR